MVFPDAVVTVLSRDWTEPGLLGTWFPLSPSFSILGRKLLIQEFVLEVEILENASNVRVGLGPDGNFVVENESPMKCVILWDVLPWRWCIRELRRWIPTYKVCWNNLKYRYR